MVNAGLERTYPFQSHTMDLGAGVVMHYLDEGPRVQHILLMLHGNPTWSYFYRGLIAGLSDTWRCVAPDHVGCGLSSKPAQYPYRLEQHIENLVRLVDHLGVKKVSLILHDWGGAIGMGLATRRPELVERLVVMNTAAFWSARIPWRIRLCRLPWLGALLVRGCNAFAAGALSMAMGGERLKGEVAGSYILPYDSWDNRVAVHEFVRDIPVHAGHVSYGVLRGIEAALPHFKDHPVLLLWGMRDFCFNAEFLERWRREFPAARMVRYEHAGHYLLEEAGGEILGEVRAFLGGT